MTSHERDSMTHKRLVMDSSERNEDGEYPVVAWDPGAEARGGAERLGDDFGTYALRRCQTGLS
ncbi:hypothetical protein [Amycolatopsis taiwanensis]|nr:hypothetical protein [Amycolatopsis taiwanensis]